MQLQTFNDRLSSFQNLTTNPAIWTFFGIPASDRDTVYTHDAISEALASYGVVGMIAFLAVLVTILSVSHRVVWRATKSSERSYAALLLSFIFANLFVGALLQSHIAIYPINFIFWMCTGALLKITFNQQSIAEANPRMDLVTLVEASRNKQTATVMAPFLAAKR